jgi:hypothetical protein
VNAKHDYVLSLISAAGACSLNSCMFLIEPNRGCNCEFCELQIEKQETKRYNMRCQVSLTVDVGDCLEEDRPASLMFFTV